MPALTLFCKDKGLPKATTHSPARSDVDEPISIVGNAILAPAVGTIIKNTTLLHMYL
jgi:hypothetical protein